MTPEQRAKAIQDGVDRAHSFRSPGHWDATTRELIGGWQAADKKVAEATSVELLFLASVSRELNAQVLRDRKVEGPWNA
jgi:hypothetical protein